MIEWQNINNNYVLSLKDLKAQVRAGYIGNPHVYSVVNKMLMESANIPWYQYKIKNPIEFKRYKQLKANGEWEQALAIEKRAVEIYETNNDLQKLLVKPNKSQTFEQFIQSLLGSYILTGDAMGYGVPSSLKTRPGLLELIPLPPQYVSIVPTGDWDGTIDKYVLIFSSDEGVEFKTNEILHIKSFNPEISETSINGKTYKTLALRGMSMFSPLANSIQGSNDGFIAQVKQLQNGGPAGILSNKSNMPMLGSQIKSANESANDMDGYSGAHNRGKIKVTSANLEYIKIGLAAADMQLIELQKATLQNVCNCANMPLEMMSLEGSTFNNKKEALKEMWNGAILPPMNIIRDHLNLYLGEYYPEIKKGQIYIDYDHHAIPALQQDIDKMHKIWMERLQNHLATPAMYQQAMGVDNIAPDENLNKYFTTTNLRRADEPLPGRTDVNNNDSTGDSGNKKS